MYMYAETARAFLTLATLTRSMVVLITSQFTQLQLAVMSSQQNVQWNVLGVVYSYLSLQSVELILGIAGLYQVVDTMS